MKVKCKFYAWNVKGLGLYHISKVLIKGLAFTHLNFMMTTELRLFPLTIFHLLEQLVTEERTASNGVKSLK